MTKYFYIIVLLFLFSCEQSVEVESNKFQPEKFTLSNEGNIDLLDGYHTVSDTFQRNGELIKYTMNVPIDFDSTYIDVGAICGTGLIVNKIIKRKGYKENCIDGWGACQIISGDSLCHIEIECDTIGNNRSYSIIDYTFLIDDLISNLKKLRMGSLRDVTEYDQIKIVNYNGHLGIVSALTTYMSGFTFTNYKFKTSVDNIACDFNCSFYGENVPSELNHDFETILKSIRIERLNILESKDFSQKLEFIIDKQFNEPYIFVQL